MSELKKNDIIYGAAVYKTNQSEVIRADNRGIGKKFIRTSEEENIQSKIVDSKVLNLKRTTNNLENKTLNKVSRRTLNDETSLNLNIINKGRTKNLDGKNNIKLAHGASIFGNKPEIKNGESLFNGAAVYKGQNKEVINIVRLTPGVSSVGNARNIANGESLFNGAAVYKEKNKEVINIDKDVKNLNSNNVRLTPGVSSVGNARNIANGESLINGAAVYRGQDRNIINDDKSDIGRSFIKQDSSSVLKNTILQKARKQSGIAKAISNIDLKSIENNFSNDDKESFGDKVYNEVGYRVLNAPRQSIRLARTTRRSLSTGKYAIKSTYKLANEKETLKNIIIDKNRGIYKGRSGITTTIKDDVIRFDPNDENLGIQSVINTKNSVHKSYKTVKNTVKTSKIIVQKSGKMASQAINYTSVLIKKIASNPVALKGIAIIALIVIIMMGAMTAVTSITTLISASTYPAEDKDINQAYLSITKNDAINTCVLKNMIADYEKDNYVVKFSGGTYDTDIDNLISYLSVKYDDKFDDIESKIASIYSQLYELNTNFWDEKQTSTKTNSDGSKSSETIIIHHLDIILKTKSVSDYVEEQKANNNMTKDEYERYDNFNKIGGMTLRQDLISPFKNDEKYNISKTFGWHIEKMAAKYKMKLHHGIDISAKSGTSINACKQGVVTEIGNNEECGDYVVIKSGDLKILYGSCSPRVEVNQKVGVEDVIGTVMSYKENLDMSSPHLHLEYKKNGEYFNPLYYLENNKFSIKPTTGNNGGSNGSGFNGTGAGIETSDEQFKSILDAAQECIGLPYKMGGRNPAQGYLDCSGFVSWVYTQAGIIDGDKTAQGLCDTSKQVSESELKPGDLIFFQKTYDCPDVVTHVAIYISPGTMLHSGNPCGYANYTTDYWQNHIYGYGRLT